MDKVGFTIDINIFASSIYKGIQNFEEIYRCMPKYIILNKESCKSILNLLYSEELQHTSFLYEKEDKIYFFKMEVLTSPKIKELDFRIY